MPATSRKLAVLAARGSFAVLDETQGSRTARADRASRRQGKARSPVLSPGGPERDGSVNAYSARGERLGEAPFRLSTGARSADGRVRTAAGIAQSGGAHRTAGERFRQVPSASSMRATQWHRVGLISGESREEAQPLLAPLYYIEKALKPLRRPRGRQERKPVGRSRYRFQAEHLRSDAGRHRHADRR